MKILCLQSSSVFESYGGIESYLDDFLSLLTEVETVKEVRTLIGYRRPITTSERPYQFTTVPLQAPGILQKFSNRYSPKLFQEANRQIQTCRPDVLMCGHVSLAPLTWLLSKTHGIPYWVIAYGIEAWGNLFPLDELALSKAHKILSISHWTKKVLVNRGYPEKSIAVVHPVLDPLFVNAGLTPHSFSKRPPLRILTVARLNSEERYKGHDAVLSVMGLIQQRSPELLPHYTIQGEGSDLERIKGLVTQYDLSHAVRFLGKVKERRDLVGVYRESDLFLMPSTFGYRKGKWQGEGFGIVYAEAAGLGIPSIAYDCGGAQDIIIDRESGRLLPPDDKEALFLALMEVLKNPELLPSWGNRAREIVQERFSPESIKKEMQKAFVLEGVTKVGRRSNAVDVTHVGDTL